MVFSTSTLPHPPQLVGNRINHFLTSFPPDFLGRLSSVQIVFQLCHFSHVQSLLLKQSSCGLSHSSGCLPTSVPRLAKFRKLWLYFKGLWPFFVGLFNIWPTFEPALAFLCYWANRHCCKWPNIE